MVVTTSIEIINVVDVYNQCKTATADPTQYRMDVYHRATPTDSFQLVGYVDYETEGIIAGGQPFTDNPNITFNLAGEYSFIQKANITKNVPERDTTNNTKQSANKNSQRMGNEAVILDGTLKVLPNAA